jgi:hypothetical protein
MQNPMYEFSAPIFIKQLGGLKNILTKSEAFCREKGMSEEEFLNLRLWEDMFPFVKQVQVACDNAKGATARLAGVEVPSYEDNEKTFAELQARVDKTLEFVKSVPESAFANAETAKVSLPYWKGKHTDGFTYLRQYALPNFLFHTVTAYDIARKTGVPVGKSDYINGLELKD